MLVDDSTEVQRVRYARVYILQILRGYLKLDKSRNLDPWQTIFTLEREEASVNLCQKITTGPFKYKDKGWPDEPINSSYAITDPNGASNDAYTTAPSD
ncbi:hypothetical protein Goarm_006710, partial [Gossypium armourianum]|nr:hypothetical protein [Gossypium armourianum]